MTPIDRDQVLQDVKYYMGYLSSAETGPNKVPDNRILSLIESIILKVGDDVKNQPDVTCATLKSCAKQNLAFSTLDHTGNIKRDKSNFREFEYFNGKTSEEYWSDYLNNSVPIFCEIMGACTTNPNILNLAQFINPGEELCVPARVNYWKAPK